jgi:hypothetical protein
MVPISMVILRRSFKFNEFMAMAMAMVLTDTNALNGDEEEECVVSGDDAWACWPNYERKLLLPSYRL